MSTVYGLHSFTHTITRYIQVWLGIFVFLMLHMAEAAAEIVGIEPAIMGLTFCAAGESCILAMYSASAV
jgi:hypothetical protein